MRVLRDAWLSDADWAHDRTDHRNTEMLWNVDFQNKISYNEVIVNVKGNIMATLKDIAKEAGVSAMTVSRVMNGNSRAVSEQTARKVRRIAEELGYVPNSSARALVSHSSRLIAALLTEEEQGRSPLSDGYNGFFSGSLQGRSRDRDTI